MFANMCKLLKRSFTQTYGNVYKQADSLSLKPEEDSQVYICKLRGL